MKYLRSTENFFDFTNLFESANLSDVALWEKINSMALPGSTHMSPQMELATLNHQSFLLDNFDSIEEANRCERILMTCGYNPVFLTLENAYFQTLDLASSLTEGLKDSVLSFLSAVTEGGSAIGILHFVLDIIGLIPASWVGFPIDIAANILNAIIYFSREMYILGIINMIMAIPGVGTVIGGVLKGMLTPFKAILNVLGKGIVLGEKTLIKSSIASLKAADGSAPFIAKLAPALKQAAGAMATTGAKFLGGLTGLLNKGIRFVTLGTRGLPKSAMKWSEELVAKAKTMAAGADEAAELLLKDQAAVAATAADSAAIAATAATKEVTQAAKAAGKTSTETAELVAKETERITGKFTNISKLSQDLVKEVTTSPSFKKLVAEGAPESVQTAFISNGVQKRLMNTILSETKGSKSLINALKQPEVVAAFGKKGTSKITDKALSDAIKKGDPAELGELLTTILSNPKLEKAISPRTARALQVFRTNPEALINGQKIFDSAFSRGMKETGKTVAKEAGETAAKRVAKEGAESAWKLGKRRSLKYYLVFVLKMYIKQSPCAKYLISGTPDEALTKMMAAASDAAMSEIPTDMVVESVKRVLALEHFITEEESSTTSAFADFAKISMPGADDLAGLSPEAKTLFDTEKKEAEAATKKVIEKNSPQNPCSTASSTARALAGASLTFQTGLYKAKGGGDVTEIFDDETAKSLTNVTKSQLKICNQDPNIDPQYPLNAEDPYVKAYMSDVWSFEEEIYMPNTGEESRLDKTLENITDESGQKITDPAKIEDIREQTLNHWANDTAPQALTDKLAEVGQIDEAYSHNRLAFLGIGGVKVTR